jgi:hypothetical protein
MNYPGQDAFNWEKNSEPPSETVLGFGTRGRDRRIDYQVVVRFAYISETPIA